MNRLFSFFKLTKRERGGFFVLCCLLLLVLLMPLFWQLFQPMPSSDYRLVELTSTVDLRVDAERQHSVSMPSRRLTSTQRPNRSLFHFDPNGLPITDWVRLGLSEKQAQTIKRYEAKGGRFRTKEDLQKMFVITDHFYAEIEPYIQIRTDERTSSVKPLSSNNDDAVTVKDRGRSAIRVPINTADTSTWKALRGIGSVYASRIVRFREALGGFYSPLQLREVYGMTDELFEQIAPYLAQDDTPIRKIKVNSWTKEELRKHPYLNVKQAEVLVNYRTQHGAFSSMDDLTKIHVLNDEILRKIEPYLDFER